MPFHDRNRVKILLYKCCGFVMINCQTKEQDNMRRHSVWLVLALFIVILSYVAENEVTAAAAPEPCFFDLPPFRPRRRRPKENDDDDDDKPDKDKDKDKPKKVPGQLLDQISKDFKKLMKLL